MPSAGEIATVNTNAGIAQRQYEHARAELARLMSQTSGTEQPEIPLEMFERAIRNLVEEEREALPQPPISDLQGRLIP